MATTSKTETAAGQGEPVSSQPNSGQPDPNQPPNKPRRRWRFLFRALVVVICMAGGLSVWAKVTLDRIERQAAQLSDAGVSLNKFLREYAENVKQRDVPGLLELYDDDYSADNEGLWVETLQSERDGVRVYDWQVDDPRAFNKEDLRLQIEDHLSQIAAIDKGKFKILSIQELNDDDTAVIRGVLWLRGISPDQETMESRTWFLLSLRRHDQNWKITSKEMLYGQTVRGSGQGFTDITELSGIDFESRHNPMLDEPEWRPKQFAIMKYSSGSVCTCDYNNDGWVDVLFSDGGSTRLYRNLGQARFEDATAQAGLPLDIKGGTMSLMVDLDNDNDKDLLLCRGTGQNYLFSNNGDGTFKDVTEGAGVQGVWVATAAAADYNNDGLVDIYLGRYLDPRTNLPTTSFYTRNSEGNSLLRNDGNLRFTDVSKEAGVRDGGLTLGIAWGDYNNDDYQDIYVANDFGRNALFKNNGDGSFTDVSAETGTTGLGYGMSSQFADVDNDGDLDIYMAGVHSSQRWLGNSATIHRYLATSVREGTFWEDYPAYLELHSLLGNQWRKLGEEVLKGNMLMLNNGDGTFADVTEEARVNPHGWYWSSCMFDFDNDGRQDIYTVNGWITGKQADDL